MNRLAVELVKGILSEAEVPRKEIVGMFGGGFKPPTVGHLEVVKRALGENPEMDRMVIFVGSGERDSITQEESLAIWRIYQKYLPKKVEVQPAPEGKAPISAVYSYAKNNPNKDVYWFLGAREGNEEDSIDIIKRTKSLQSGNYPNVTVKKILTGGTVSGTKTRKALLARDKETFIQALPDIPEVDQIWNMLSDSMNLLEIGIKLKNFTGQVNPGDTISAVKGAYVYGGGKKNYLKRRKVFKVVDNDRLGVNRYRLNLEDPQGRKFFIHNYEMDGEYKGKKIPKWSMVKNTPIDERVNFNADFISKGDVEFVDDMADRRLAPVDIDLSGNHFFDRLNDPRNFPDISIEELEEFFDKLADEKEEFIEFLRKYKDVVVKDTESNLNIPFMKRANKAIAKTIMRKKNFKTPNVVLPLDEGRYDAEVTMISRMIINFFKDSLGEEVSETFEDAGELDGEPYNLEVYLRPSDFDTLGPNPFIINAAGDEDAIAIQINYQLDQFPDAFNELIPELKDAIRHELEHTGQGRFDKGAASDGVDQDNLDLVDYLTLDYEVPAFVQGIYKNAKTRKISFSQALQNFLDERVDELTPDEEAKVKKIYTDFAKKNLPAAQFEGLSPKEKDIVDDILSEVNNLQEVDLDKLKEKIKSYGRKGMLTLSILLSVAGSLQANPGIAKDIIDTGIELSEPGQQTDFYSAMVGYTQKLLDVAMEKGDINNVGNLKEVKLHYEALRDNETPSPLSNKGKQTAQTVLKGLSQVSNTAQFTNYINFGSGINTVNEADPKKGTGKKPKGSGRRLYTDEDPKDTVKIKFSTRQDIVDTLNKTSFKNKSHARQSQVINLIHQRVRAALGRTKDPKKKKRLQTAFNYIKKRKEASKAKTKRLQAQKKKKKTNENVAPNHNQKSSPYGSGYKPLKEDLMPAILSLTQYMGSNGLNLKPYPKLKFIDDNKENAKNILGRTAYYDPNQQLVALYTMDRHPKDILRSYAHELIHHHQNLNNTLDHSQTTNTNADSALDKIEREAYEQGNILFRNWEDSIKNEK